MTGTSRRGWGEVGLSALSLRKGWAPITALCRRRSELHGQISPPSLRHTRTRGHAKRGATFDLLITCTREIDMNTVSGKVTFGSSGRPAPGVRIIAADVDVGFDRPLGETKTDERGYYALRYDPDRFREAHHRAPVIYLSVHDKKGDFLTDTRASAVRHAGAEQEINVQLAERGPDRARGIVVGGTPVDRERFAALKPEVLLHLAESAVYGPGKEANDRELAALSPELDPRRLAS